MYGRSGLERFKKAESSEPFSVTSSKTTTTTTTQPSAPSGYYSNTAVQQPQSKDSAVTVGSAAGAPSGFVTQVGGGQSNWEPPDWAIEPRRGVYYLDVLKDGQVIGQVSLDKKRHIFGRQVPMCDYVLDHQSISRQHAAVVPHKNGSVYVIDLGSVHGTFVANERLTKDNPVELEVGQSLRFAASTRTYILRKNMKALLPPPLPAEINLPPPPDPSDEEAVLAYNTTLNKYGICKAELLSKSTKGSKSSLSCMDDSEKLERAAKRSRKTRVLFKDQVGGELVQVVGVSDGAHVETEPGPMGVKEGSLVGKYESLIEVTVIPKGKEQNSSKQSTATDKGVTDKLKEVLNKVKSAPKSNGIYDDLYGELYPGQVGSSWAYSSVASDNGQPFEQKGSQGQPHQDAADKPSEGRGHDVDDSDDLFGD